MLGTTTIIHGATPAFPMPYAFNGEARWLDPWKDDLVVQMKDFLPFLNTAPGLRLCTIRSKFTKKHVDDFDAVVRRLKGTGNTTRRYIYAEGCVNLSLHPHCVLADDQRLLTVKRECACGAVRWSETVTVKDLKDRTLHLTFTEHSTVHKENCVVPGSTERSHPLIGQFVYVKELAADRTNTTSKIEVGAAHFDQHAHDLSVISDLAQHGKDLPRGFIQETIKNARASSRGRSGEGDFDLTHRRITELVAEADGDLERIRVVEYHPVADMEATDPTDPQSWYWYLVEMPHAARDMADRGAACVALDGKVKGVLTGGIIIPIMTTVPGLPCITDPRSNQRIPLHGLRHQHRGQVNYILYANTEAHGVMSAVLSTVRGLLTCNNVGCNHPLSMREGAGGGYTLERSECAGNVRPGEWERELYDACAAYLKSSYRRMSSGLWPKLKEPIICRYHDIVCHLVSRTIGNTCAPLTRLRRCCCRHLHCILYSHNTPLFVFRTYH